MKNKKILWSALVVSVSFLGLFYFWWDSSSAEREVSVPKVQEKDSVQVQLKAKPLEKKIEKPLEKKVEKKPSVEELSEHERFMREFYKLEHENHETQTECYDNIDKKLDDLDYIDPRSELFSNFDRLDSLMYNTLGNMGSTGASLEISWAIEDYLKNHEPPNINILIDRYHSIQEVCLVQSGVIFLQTSIEACSYNCPPRLKSLIGNLVFDGIPLMLSSFLGSERLMLALTLMEKANRFGPYHLSLTGEIEDLRYRVQQNYEIYQEELKQNEGRAGRMAQAFTRYVEDNKFLKNEILNLLENSAERYYP